MTEISLSDNKVTMYLLTLLGYALRDVHAEVVASQVSCRDGDRLDRSSYSRVSKARNAKVCRVGFDGGAYTIDLSVNLAVMLRSRERTAISAEHPMDGWDWHELHLSLTLKWYTELEIQGVRLFYVWTRSNHFTDRNVLWRKMSKRPRKFPGPSRHRRT